MATKKTNPLAKKVSVEQVCVSLRCVRYVNHAYVQICLRTYKGLHEFVDVTLHDFMTACGCVGTFDENDQENVYWQDKRGTPRNPGEK
jgi:hypothetical protein